MEYTEPFHIPVGYKRLQPVLLGHPRVKNLDRDIIEPSAEQRRAAATLFACVNDVRRKVGSITVLHGEEGRMRPLEEALHPREMNARIGRSAPFFLIGESRSHVCAVLPGRKDMRLIGAFNEEMETHMTIAQCRMRPLLERGYSALPSLVRCPQGGLVFATGAGIGPENAVLRDHATERGGLLLCHDVVPQVIDAVKKRPYLRDIPYVILPPHPQFLAPVLRSHPGPRTIVAQNLLSVCHPECIENLLQTAREGGAGKIVFSQTSAAALPIGFAPPDYTPGERNAFATAFQQLMDREVDGGTISCDTIQRNMPLIIQQAFRTYECLGWELARRYLIEVGLNECGFTSVRTFMVERSEMTEGYEACDFITTYDEQSLSAFEAGHFNQMTGSLVRQHRARIEGVPEGSLQMTQLELALVLTKDDAGDIAAEDLDADRLTEVDPGEPFIPPTLRFVDRLPEWEGEADDANGSVRRLVARLTHAVMFGEIARGEGNGIFTQHGRLDEERQRTIAQTLKEAYT
ncbi:MAG: hypothetical protein Greene041619_985 [Candidatus Peregrinibacteria bacterium Greene0416_19]|nr:MAG: hypothetical protein Greene041619_985 [Candidatus Peregrinibacteria bacterium Greene0416_19]